MGYTFDGYGVDAGRKNLFISSSCSSFEGGLNEKFITRQPRTASCKDLGSIRLLDSERVGWSVAENMSGCVMGLGYVGGYDV